MDDGNLCALGDGRERRNDEDELPFAWPNGDDDDDDEEREYGSDIFGAESGVGGKRGKENASAKVDARVQRIGERPEGAGPPCDAPLKHYQKARDSVTQSRAVRICRLLENGRPAGR